MLLLFFSSLHVQHPMTHMETHQRILALLLVILVKIRFASPVHLQRDIIQFLTQPNQTRLCECITESLYIPFYAVNSRSLCHLELLLLLLLTTKFSCSCYPKNWRIILHARTVLRTVLRGKEVIIHFFRRSIHWFSSSHSYSSLWNESFSFEKRMQKRDHDLHHKFFALLVE